MDDPVKPWTTFLISTLLLSPFCVNAGNSSTVCVVTIREDISHNTLFLMRRALREAEAKNAVALILEMDTNGGRVDATEEIIRLLEHTPLKTYTFINPKAFSAGAYIAAATDAIYMTPGSVIGAATPIMMVPGGGEVAKLPENYEEKLNSAMRALIRSTAQRKGHNPDVFEAMVDKDRGLTVEGTVIVEKGKLLTLTNQEAVRAYGAPPKALLSAGTVKAMEEMLVAIGLPGATMFSVEPFGFEVMGRWLTMLGPLFIVIGLVAVYMELKAPGLGVPTLVAVAAFGLFFFGHFAAGLAGWEDVALFAIGMALVAVEVFVLPGFGAAGIAGIVCVLASLVLGMTQRWPGGSWWPSWTDLHWPMVKMALSFAGSLVVMAWLARWLPKTSVFQRLELDATLGAAKSSAAAAQPLVGAVGVSETMLRPAGKGRFGDQLVDVETEGDFIGKGERIRIVMAEGSRVVVTQWTSN